MVFEKFWFTYYVHLPTYMKFRGYLRTVLHVKIFGFFSSWQLVSKHSHNFAFCFFQTLRLCEHTPPRWNVQQTAKWITERRENQCHSSTVQHRHQWAGLISRQVRLYSPSQKRTWTFCVICNNTHSLDLFISFLKLTKYFIFTFKISVCVHFYQRHLCRPKV